MISIIDYGAGNIASISNALRKVGAKTQVVSQLDNTAQAIVLPGVGNFGDAMKKIAPIKQDLLDSINSGTPFLGLCLGLQVLLKESEEAPGIKGLGIETGPCKRFKGIEVPNGKIPHMGWNQISKLKGPLFEGINESDNFYFVHSYYAPVMEDTAAVCNYGINFSAALQKENVFACQFHPERSGSCGLKILENWVKLTKK